MIEVKINSAPLAALLGVKPGDTMQVKCKNGIPVNREWRNRFKDSKIDGCVSVVQKAAKTSKGIK